MRRVQIVVLVVLLSLLVSAPPLVAQDNEVAWLLEHINCLRQSVGAPPLTLSVALTRSANRQSHNLSNDNLTNFHIGLDGSTPTTRAQDEGFTGSVGENVAGGGTAADAFRWWLGSPVHYENMTNAHWKEIGIGVGNGPNGPWYTLDFGALNWQIIPATSVLPCDTEAQPILILGEDLPTETPTPGPSPTPLPPTPTITSFDEHGYIQHSIQSGETPGLIILKYGYAWEDLPALMELNHMTEAEARRLNVGDIFLVPVREGTFTPVPAEEDTSLIAVASDTPESSEQTSLVAATETPVLPSATFPPTLTPLPTYTPTSTLTETLLPSQTSVPTLISTTAPSVIPASTETLLPPAIFAVTDTLVPQVASAASITPIPITIFPPVPPEAPASASDTSQPLVLVLGGVVVVQALIIGAMWARGRRKR